MKKIGVLGINKPIGMTSFDIVRVVKKKTGIKKIGHGGTLDPMATGVLPILFNEATAFFDLLLNSVKVYKTEIQLGAFTDTDDKEGKIIQALPVGKIELSDIMNKIKSLTGEILQEPPIYSAINVNGKRAYELARLGQEVKLTPRKTIVYGWENICYDSKNHTITAVIKCGSGTYIRSLGKDLAKLLNTGGYLISLQRISSGGIDIKDTIDLEEIEDKWQNQLISPEKALSFLPQIEWQEKLEYLIHGKPLPKYLYQQVDQVGIYRLMYHNKIISLVEFTGDRLVYKNNFANIYKDILL